MQIEKYSDLFIKRHLGTTDKDQKSMLSKLGFDDVEDFINEVIPKDIQIQNNSKSNLPTKRY